MSMGMDYRFAWHDDVLCDKMSVRLPWYSPPFVVRTNDGFVFGPPEVRTVLGVPPRDWRLLAVCLSMSWGDVLYTCQALISRRAVQSITAQCDMHDMLCYVSVGGRVGVRPYVRTIRPLTAPDVLMYYLADNEEEVERLDGYGRTWRYAMISARGACMTLAVEAHDIDMVVRKLAAILRVPEDAVSTSGLPAWEEINYVQVLA